MRALCDDDQFHIWGKEYCKLLWRDEWHSHLGPNSGMVRQVGAVSADSPRVPTRARCSAWCAQICSATVVFMRTRSFDFECLGSQTACRMCQSPPIASNSIAFGPVMPTVQLVARPVLLSTYIYLEKAAKQACRDLQPSVTASFDVARCSHVLAELIQTLCRHLTLDSKGIRESQQY